MNDKQQKIFNIIVISLIFISCIVEAAIIDIVVVIAYLFVQRRICKLSYADIGFKHKNIIDDLKKYWWLVLLPVLSGFLALAISKVVLPEYYLHVLERTNMTELLSNVFLFVALLLVLSLLEEMTYRAILQNTISKFTKPIIGIIITSILFAISHYSAGPTSIVVYDLLFIFIDSVIYGFVFERTKNIYMGWLSHFIANFASFLFLLLL